ncbi:MAG TPA: ABC transporter ATP-binding protein [Chitinispirillaceae bacterium]|nr:ABC transporter ATP-binding protein [Chitinispirillaceae bacterium]
MSEPLFILNQVSFSYNKIPALKNVNLTINCGECISIIGANGTGKSTLLNLLDALIFPTGGTVTAFGSLLTEKELNNFEKQRMFRRRVGFVFQNPDIQLFCPTVRDDILFGVLHLEVEKREIEKRFEHVVELMKITHLLKRSPHQLSIGEKKKAAIASVLIIEPDVLLLDEPTAGLDPQTTRDIIDILFKAHRNGKTVVMATHDLHLAEEISDTVHVFGSEHNIIRSGTVEEVLSDQQFLQKNNLMHIHVHRHLHGAHIHPHIHH